MPGIKYNQLTREIELAGSESFIESNFRKIQDRIVESFGVEKRLVSKETKRIYEAITVVKVREAQKDVKMPEPSEVSQIAAEAKPCISVLSQEVKATRPPLRKYIRKVGVPGHERTVVEVAEQKSPEISIQSLREKFGLTKSKIGGIIREAEKLGKVRRVMNGSYVWSQD